MATHALSAEECTGTITADEAMKVETARFAAQTANDFAAMEKMFGNGLTYNHSSAATDGRAKYIEAMRSGRTKYRTMTANYDVKTRTYGCLAIITGTAVYEVTSDGQDRTLPLRVTTILGEAAVRARVRVVAVDRHPAETIANGRLAGRLACAKVDAAPRVR